MGGEVGEFRGMGRRRETCLVLRGSPANHAVLFAASCEEKEGNA